MKFNFLWLVAGGFLILGIIWKGYKYNGNPIFANYNFIFWVLAIAMFIAACFVYRRENHKE